MSARPLPTGAPAEEGVDAKGVQSFLDALEAMPDTTHHSLMILRHGKVVADGWWAPYTAERPHLLYSLSKSFTSAAAGLAVSEGLLDLDATVLSYFPELDADITDPRSRAMLVRHIASMSSGHLAETWEEAFERGGDEPVRGFLRIPPDRDPGTVFAYNQPTTYTLAAIIQRLTGGSLTEYLRPRLFAPLGIGAVNWLSDHTGRELGFSGMFATTDAIARLGQLHLQGGRWEGRELLPGAWVAEATRLHTANPGMQNPDWNQGYGFQFWMSRHGYRGDGAFGQFCLVLPEHDVVIAMTSETEDMQAVLDAAWQHLLPAFGPAPLENADKEDDALRGRLDALAVAPLTAAEAAPADPAAWFGAPFTPAADAATRRAGLTTAALAPLPGGGWTLTLTEPGADFVLNHGAAGWTVTERPAASVPVAISGGWTGGATFTADLLFLETPHRLSLSCSLPDRTFTARWHTTALHWSSPRSHGVPAGKRSPEN
jgi:CubicO group peptidase (beta-lactamase class C family)